MPAGPPGCGLSPPFTGSATRAWPANWGLIWRPVRASLSLPYGSTTQQSHQTQTSCRLPEAQEGQSGRREEEVVIKVSLISLGCAKNLVDSEIMVGHLHQAGMQVVPDAEKADVVIVNTCSFIDSSKEESIGHILEVHQNRGMTKRNKGQKLIVAGCMAQRFSKDLST